MTSATSFSEFEAGYSMCKIDIDGVDDSPQKYEQIVGALGLARGVQLRDRIYFPDVGLIREARKDRPFIAGSIYEQSRSTDGAGEPSYSIRQLPIVMMPNYGICIFCNSDLTADDWDYVFSAWMESCWNSSVHLLRAPYSGTGEPTETDPLGPVLHFNLRLVKVFSDVVEDKGLNELGMEDQGEVMFFLYYAAMLLVEKVMQEVVEVPENRNLLSFNTMGFPEIMCRLLPSTYKQQSAPQPLTRSIRTISVDDLYPGEN